MEAVVVQIGKFATHDGPGIRSVVFLKGCPLRCRWCHSPETWRLQPEQYADGTVVGCVRSVDNVLAEVLRDRDFYEASGGGITVSGGEPLMRWEFTSALLGKAKAAGLHTAVETSGCASASALDAVASATDLWLYDVKVTDAKRHRALTGVGNDGILANLRRLDAQGRRIVLRCPMIPGVNDSDADLKGLAQLADELAQVERLDIEPYVPYGVDKAKKLGLSVMDIPIPPPDYAEKIVSRLGALTRRKVQIG